jgi:hypothetical protein
MKAAILSQEEDAVEDGTDGEEPSNKVESWGDDPDARADDVEYNNNVNARGGGSGLRHGMAELEAAMTKPGSTAARFAEQVGLTTVAKMAATYEEMVRSMVEDPAGALAAALAPEAKERTYLAVPNKEGVFSVFHGLTWWADAPRGVRNQQGHLGRLKRTSAADAGYQTCGGLMSRMSSSFGLLSCHLWPSAMLPGFMRRTTTTTTIGTQSCWTRAGLGGNRCVGASSRSRGNGQRCSSTTRTLAPRFGGSWT